MARQQWLQHQCSTKLLIHKYETLSSDVPGMLVPASLSASPGNGTITTGTKRSGSTHSGGEVGRVSEKGKEKDKSPIRQSIRSLLSVFKRSVPIGRKGSCGNLEEGLEGLGDGSAGGAGDGSGAQEVLPCVPSPSPGRWRHICAVSNSDEGEKGEQLMDEVRPPALSRRNSDLEWPTPRGVALFDTPVPPLLCDGSASERDHLEKAAPRQAARKKQVCSALLYLAQCPTRLGSFAGPVWLPCIAVLENGNIVLTWSGGAGNGTAGPAPEDEERSTHVVHLVRCADIRSFSASQISEHDASAPLLGCGENLHIGEFKVFEILFEGKQRERFAARTVRERARWVSAIWDVVLPSQDPRNPRSDAKTCPTPTNLMVDCGQAASSPEQSISGRPLPPVPINGSAIMTPPWRDSPNRQAPSFDGENSASDGTRSRCSSPASVYPPTRPLSRVSVRDSPVPSERCHSPSIMNLNQRSVVKQRLAQIKEMDLQRASSSASSSSIGSVSEPYGRSPRSRYIGSQSTKLTSHSSVEPRKGTSKRDECTRTRTTITTPLEEVLQHSPHVKSVPELCPTNTTINECEPVQVTSPVASLSARVGISSEKQTSLHRVSSGLLDPLAKLLRENADNQRVQVGNLGDQLAGLQYELQRLPKEISCIVGSSRGSEEGSPTVHHMLTKVERKIENSIDFLGTLDDKLSSLGNNHAQAQHQMAKANVMRDKGAAEMLRALDVIHAQLKSNLPAILARLAEVQETQKRSEELLLMHEQRPLKADRNKELPPVIDLSAILAKLDRVLEVQRKAGSLKAPDVSRDVKAELSKISSALEENNHQRTLHTQQQADSVRYLTELNSWLEAFVNNGTSQIQSVAANVDILCKELGCVSKSDSGDGAATGTFLTSNKDRNLFRDLRELVAHVQAREQNSAELQASVNALLGMMKSGRVPDAGSTVELIERQRREQASLLRSLRNGFNHFFVYVELSNEIKGERIRFVEAMKEATTINVQSQLEQFKQGLSKEVMNMSNEIGRLHHERRAIESQIQQLQGYHESQKQASLSVRPQVGDRYYAPTIDEYPTLSRDGHMSFYRG
ncbi:hypothetical protein AMATHDRAFT_83687 [Amanita thiersii Skay4041]|uniref:PH domain-containing protein n=1 Tax=Amanita thiersii Skay4041 TaxID=703135 RepID=A0A2A9P047_9AGAR|nr:hypothetical protein AMATHDRAFT_83687 [Amanita thiersii Skay4041]